MARMGISSRTKEWLTVMGERGVARTLGSAEFLRNVSKHSYSTEKIVFCGIYVAVEAKAEAIYLSGNLYTSYRVFTCVTFLFYFQFLEILEIFFRSSEKTPNECRRKIRIFRMARSVLKTNILLFFTIVNHTYGLLPLKYLSLFCS